MDVEEVSALALALHGVKRKGTATRPGWYVDDRLVARLSDPTTLVVRMPLTEREAFLERHPTGFGVQPRMEAHHKIEAYLDRVSPAALAEALRLAWELQTGSR